MKDYIKPIAELVDFSTELIMSGNLTPGFSMEEGEGDE